MRKKITAILKNLMLEDFIRSCFQKGRYFVRVILSTDKRLFRKYVKNNQALKLQLGSGSNTRDGWLNTNLYPKSYKTLHLDATKEFFFENDTFDLVYNEHMFEHITLKQGVHMVNECFRVLKPNGILRIVTPDFQFLIDLYKEQKTDLQKNYIKNNINMFLKDTPYDNDLVVINNFFRDWGHKFIYDENMLKTLLIDAGFKDVKRFPLDDSYTIEMKNIAHEERYPEGFLKLESMVVEGIKK